MNRKSKAIDQAVLVKVGSVTKPKVAINPWGPQKGEQFRGSSEEAPTIGESFLISGFNGWAATTPIKSIYVHGTGRDKLVVPKDFIHMNLPSLKLKKGDILFSTLNSIYLLTDIVWA